MEWWKRLNQGPDQVTVGHEIIELLYWAYARHLSDNIPHRHTYFEVCLVGGHGAGLFTASGRKHAIGPGDLFIARPGVLHQIVNTSAPKMELSWVSFQWVTLRGERWRDASSLRVFA